MSRQSAYKLRRRLAEQPFAAEWEEALADLRLAEPPGKCPVCGAAAAWPPFGGPGRGPR